MASASCSSREPWRKGIGMHRHSTPLLKVEDINDSIEALKTIGNHCLTSPEGPSLNPMGLVSCLAAWLRDLNTLHLLVISCLGVSLTLGLHAKAWEAPSASTCRLCARAGGAHRICSFNPFSQHPLRDTCARNKHADRLQVPGASSCHVILAGVALFLGRYDVSGKLLRRHHRLVGPQLQLDGARGTSCLEKITSRMRTTTGQRSADGASTKPAHCVADQHPDTASVEAGP